MTAQHEPNDLTRKTVSNLAKLFPKTHVAKYVGLDRRTLQKHYEAELLEGEKSTKSRLIEVAMDVAITDRNVSMLIFLLKTWVGLSEDGAEKAAKDISADPLSINFNVDESKGDITVTKGKKKA